MAKCIWIILAAYHVVSWTSLYFMKYFSCFDKFNFNCVSFSFSFIHVKCTGPRSFASTDGKVCNYMFNSSSNVVHLIKVVIKTTYRVQCSLSTWQHYWQIQESSIRTDRGNVYYVCPHLYMRHSIRLDCWVQPISLIPWFSGISCLVSVRKLPLYTYTHQLLNIVANEHLTLCRPL